ncbi:MAG: TIGR02757 family protein [Muribaculaceae bacterium]|nr:TIGR02757 family protein [Muribaculaceae bacterium]
MSATPDKDLILLLDSEATRINRPEFIESDPVQFPRRFSDPRDIEIAAFLSAIIAWGKRTMICRDAERMLALMGNEPYLYTMEEGYLDLDPSLNIHRTFFARDLAHFLRGMRRIMADYGSLEGFAASVKAGEDPFPAWKLVGEMQKVMMAENGGAADSRCLPTNLSQSALKRVNMALRWLVRDDGIVDLGIWKEIPKSKLFIPLDVHVGNTARELGLLERKSNDRKSVELLTETLRSIRPEDPVFYDYALFGIGIGE